MDRARAILLIGMFGVAVGCAPTVKPTGDGADGPPLAELWFDPGPQPRDLANGIGDGGPRPAADARYEVVSRDTAGFSITYRVRDERRREWSVKIGPEAQT